VVQERNVVELDKEDFSKVREKMKALGENNPPPRFFGDVSEVKQVVLGFFPTSVASLVSYNLDVAFSQLEYKVLMLAFSSYSWISAIVGDNGEILYGYQWGLVGGKYRQDELLLSSVFDSVYLQQGERDNIRFIFEKILVPSRFFLPIRGLYRIDGSFMRVEEWKSDLELEVEVSFIKKEHILDISFTSPQSKSIERAFYAKPVTLEEAYEFIDLLNKETGIKAELCVMEEKI